MNQEPRPEAHGTFRQSATVWLERLTALSLLLVIAAVAWMVGVTFIPGLPRLPSVEIEAVVVLSLLTAALVLVTVVALLHTRRHES